MADHPVSVTGLIQRWKEGDQAAFSELADLVYPELKRIAAARMRQERPGHTLQATAVVNELFIRLMKTADTDFATRSQFFAVAATIMRHILVDHARGKHRQKRDGERVPLDDATVAALQPPGTNMLALDEALGGLEAVDARKAKVFELRFFVGLSDQEVAEMMGVTAMTINRDYRAAKAWVGSALTP